MKNGTSLWDSFLKRYTSPVTFIDCAGIDRIFHITGHYSEEINSYSLFAKEILDSHEDGYLFQSHSYASPQDAMNKLTSKIRKELSKKYLDPNNVTHLLHQSVYGRVSSGGIVVDGVFISWTKFVEMMQIHEGWEFKLDFKGL